MNWVRSGGDFHYSNIPLIESCEIFASSRLQHLENRFPKSQGIRRFFLDFFHILEHRPGMKRNRQKGKTRRENTHTHTHRLTHDVQPLLNQAVTVESALAIFCLDLYTVYPMSREIAPTGVQGRCNSLNFRKNSRQTSTTKPTLIITEVQTLQETNDYSAPLIRTAATWSQGRMSGSFKL